MSMPLSPRSPAFLNRGQAPMLAMEKLGSLAPSLSCDSPQFSDASSPFQSEVQVNQHDFENSPSPVRQQSALKLSRSPTKGFQTFEIHEDENEEVTSLPHVASTQSPLEEITASHTRKQCFLSHVSSAKENMPQGSEMRGTSHPFGNDDEENDMRSTISDDTGFSTFSAVPNADMTLFAKLGSRTADNTLRLQTPGSRTFQTPGTAYPNGQQTSSSRSPSPTPRGSQRKRRDGDTTNLLLDFTQQSDAGHSTTRYSPSKQPRAPCEPRLLSYLNNQRMPSPAKNNPTTPGGRKNFMTLLDFDLPPQPTPRSVPTITIRELESLKSQYLSQISSLKASLSGREAEVDSLKKAVADAERRVGEAQEVVREERNAREHAEHERGEWEKKGHNVEAVLQSVRDEFVYAEKEKEDLLARLEESNRIREDMETQLAKATTKASVVGGETGETTADKTPNATVPESLIAQRVNAQLDEKMENLARELHAVYKKKHETKVSTLKKTYEARAEKRCHELQIQIETLQKQNDELQATKDTAFSRESPHSAPSTEHSADLRRLETQTAELEEHRARLAGLAEEMRSMRSSHEQLIQELEAERVEKGDLVAAVDEMLALQSEVGQSNPVVEGFRKSINRAPPSGLRGPGFAGMKNSSLPGKSKMLANIERMGTRGQ